MPLYYYGCRNVGFAYWELKWSATLTMNLLYNLPTLFALVQTLITGSDIHQILRLIISTSSLRLSILQHPDLTT